MSRKPSAETQLRAARTIIRSLKDDLAEISGERNVWRGRATKAEGELAEWKARFDLLLSRVPKLEGQG